MDLLSDLNESQRRVVRNAAFNGKTVKAVFNGKTKRVYLDLSGSDAPVIELEKIGVQP